MEKNNKNNYPTDLDGAAPLKHPKAIVILLHGLNLKPQKMDDWAFRLGSHGAYVLRFPLFGHSGDEKHMRNVTAEIWRNQFKAAIKKAQKRAAEFDVPIYFLGFSLGALVALEWLAGDQESNAIKKMVLIAPALSIPWYSKAVVKIFSLFGSGLILPSRSPKNYRANKGTSIAAYQSLFALKESLEEKKYSKLNVDTLVLIDRHDELVDAQDIKNIIEKYRLSQWTLEIVDNRFAYDNYGFRHLMVDEEAMGKALWASISSKVLRHFNL